MTIDFKKCGGLVPVVVQDALTARVLMLGYMNEEALQKTLHEGRVTFYSRSKQTLWTKGDTSGNYLDVVRILPDCDNDTLLIQARPAGPVCHTGTVTCFKELGSKGFLYRLQDTISQRISGADPGSYTARLYQSGINKMAQKVGEEALELVIEAKDDNEDLFRNEAADLLYHFLVLLRARGQRLEDIEAILEERSRKAGS
jgi:phosphoribosyl-ATP pyrophosphohydrolase/phosphoribosyl-AMP cyclohydrolase